MPLERLKELEQAATPGPWMNEDHMIYGPKHEQSKHRNGRVYITRVEQGVVRADPGLDGGADRFGFDSMADTRLIVALRNNAEALIEVAEAAREYRKAQERALEIEGAGPGFSEMLWQGHLATAQDAEEIMRVRLDAALAKLEVEK